eukprot:scaffold19114_cov118-Isochrysis_galbana.AAC.12
MALTADLLCSRRGCPSGMIRASASRCSTTESPKGLTTPPEPPSDSCSVIPASAAERRRTTSPRTSARSAKHRKSQTRPGTVLPPRSQKRGPPAGSPSLVPHPQGGRAPAVSPHLRARRRTLSYEVRPRTAPQTRESRHASNPSRRAKGGRAPPRAPPGRAGQSGGPPRCIVTGGGRLNRRGVAPRPRGIPESYRVAPRFLFRRSRAPRTARHGARPAHAADGAGWSCTRRHVRRRPREKLPPARPAPPRSPGAPPNFACSQVVKAPSRPVCLAAATPVPFPRAPAPECESHRQPPKPGLDWPDLCRPVAPRLTQAPKSPLLLASQTAPRLMQATTHPLAQAPTTPPAQEPAIPPEQSPMPLRCAPSASSPAPAAPPPPPPPPPPPRPVVLLRLQHRATAEAGWRASAGSAT